jgi:hypothetical protein
MASHREPVERGSTISLESVDEGERREQDGSWLTVDAAGP